MAFTPADYPLPVDPEREFVTAPTDSEGNRIEFGVVIVGGGPAGLACAIRLMQLLESEPALAKWLGDVPAALVEKGRATGSHLLSGALMEPSAMRRLFPDLDESAWPTYGTVEKEAIHLLTNRRAFKLPRVPPPFRKPRQPRDLDRAAGTLAWPARGGCPARTSFRRLRPTGCS